MPSQCRNAYLRFYEEHRTHKDPVCFRAVVFCTILAEWCARWNFAIHVNCHHKSRHEFLMLLMLQYQPSRCLRLVETMTITHFIEWIHTSFINKFPFTRVRPFERFMKWQWLNNPQAVAQAKDLQRAFIRLDVKKSRHHTGSRSHGPPREGEEDGIEGSVKRLQIGRDANQ